MTLNGSTEDKMQEKPYLSLAWECRGFLVNSFGKVWSNAHASHECISLRVVGRSA